MMGYNILILYCIGQSVLTTVSGYICDHDPLPVSQIQKGFTSGIQSIPAQIDIKFHSIDVPELWISPNLLNNVSQFIRKNVFVKRPSQKIHLSRNCPPDNGNSEYCTERCVDVTYCGAVPVPSEHVGRCYICVNADAKRCGFTVESSPGAGIQAHLIVYLTSVNTDRCINGGEVEASACQVSPQDNRPIAGYINICPGSWLTSKDAFFNILVHQIFHIMGISSGLYDLYNGESKIGRVPQKWSTNNDPEGTAEEYMLYGLNSRHFMEKHFQCQNGYGILMENQDPRFSHFEERLYRGEGMTVNITDTSVFSKLTLAALQDTGWYITGEGVNPSFSGQVNCDLVDRSCNLWVKERENAHDNIFPFCDIDSIGFTCDPTHRKVLECKRKSYSVGTIPSKFLYHTTFGNSDMAGPYTFSDYCMLFENSNIQKEGESCQMEPVFNEPNVFLERFGERSACFLHEGPWSVNGGAETKGAGCYSVCCREYSFDVIDINREAHSCYKPKQTIHLNSLNNNIRGSLTCPSLETVCDEKNRPTDSCLTPGKCITPSLRNGQVYSSQGMYQITISTTLSYVCFDGYVMRGASSAVCLGNNKFSAPLPECKLPCQLPEIPNGNINSTLSTVLIGDSIEIHCDVDYKLSGARILTCVSENIGDKIGTWSREIPTCLKEYLEWSSWGPCSIQCGLENVGNRIRTRGCSTCTDFEWEKKPCYSNLTCPTSGQSKDTNTKGLDKDNLILLAVFGVLFPAIILFIVVLMWYFNKSQTAARHPRSQLFNESYYLARRPKHGHRQTLRQSRSLDLSSEYSIASGSMKQLFTFSTPPSSPYYQETKRKRLKDSTRQVSEDHIDDLCSEPSFIIPVKYKKRARVFPKVQNTDSPPPYSLEAEKNIALHSEQTVVKHPTIRLNPDTNPTIRPNPDANLTIRPNVDKNQTTRRNPDTNSTIRLNPDTNSTIRLNPDKNQTTRRHPDTNTTIRLNPDTNSPSRLHPDTNSTIRLNPDTNSTIRLNPDARLRRMRDQADAVKRMEQNDLEKLRASIRAARLRVRNHPSIKRLVVADPITGEAYNPNRVPFEIEEKDEDLMSETSSNLTASGSSTDQQHIPLGGSLSQDILEKSLNSNPGPDAETKVMTWKNELPTAEPDETPDEMEVHTPIPKIIGLGNVLESGTQEDHDELEDADKLNQQSSHSRKGKLRRLPKISRDSELNDVFVIQNANINSEERWPSSEGFPEVD